MIHCVNDTVVFSSKFDVWSIDQSPGYKGRSIKSSDIHFNMFSEHEWVRWFSVNDL